MKVAAVDIGTNSTRLLIAQPTPDGLLELERASHVTRLGAGVDSTGRLAPDAIERVFDTLDRYLTQAREQGCQRQLAVLTSAARDARNGPEFALAIEQRYGIKAEIVDGDREAQLTFKGATHDRQDGPEDRIMVVDIGGGSTELVIGQSGLQPDFHVSVQTGVVRQTERHLKSDPPTTSEIEELRDDVQDLFRAALPIDSTAQLDRIVAVAGTATACAAIDQQLEPYDPDKVHGYELSSRRVTEILDLLAGLPLKERKLVPGLHPDRAQTAVAGMAILAEIVEIFQFEVVEVSNHDILHGIALELSSTNETIQAQLETSPSQAS